MSFEINSPSIPAIRAKFLIDKLCDFPKTVASINLWATGRTGSGKTTLGNHLVGIDYFMPSTGKQDCTDEVNLVEFPIGLKYFDLPGVCSDDRLDNYNRAALGIKQIENFSVVEELTLAKYSQGKEGKTVQKQSFTVSDFRKSQLEPDLILYLIAPDKQFLSVDYSYLQDLLKHYRQVICVFNMFADKETRGVAAATEQNIIDAATRIKKVYASALGSNSQPIIVPVNCWTGEGISDLLARSYEVLGGEKGKIFEELIQYQQQKTPDEYLRQTKRELLRLFAHGACQKPEGTYTCDQPLHKDCHTLWKFMADLQVKSEQPSYHQGEKINSLVGEVLASSSEESQQVSHSIEQEISSLKIGLNSIEHGIDYLNEAINTYLVQSQREARESCDIEIRAIEK